VQFCTHKSDLNPTRIKLGSDVSFIFNRWVNPAPQMASGQPTNRQQHGSPRPNPWSITLSRVFKCGTVLKTLALNSHSLNRAAMPPDPDSALAAGPCRTLQLWPPTRAAPSFCSGRWPAPPSSALLTPCSVWTRAATESRQRPCRLVVSQ
jgi:hypothetical protein